MGSGEGLVCCPLYQEEQLGWEDGSFSAAAVISGFGVLCFSERNMMSAQGCCDAPAQSPVQRWLPGHRVEAQAEARKATGVSEEALDSLLQAQMNAQGETWALAKPTPPRPCHFLPAQPVESSA